MNWESSIEIYILPYAKLIASGKLLYNTGSSTQCSMTTYRSGTGWGVRRMFRREGTYAHLWLIHIVVRQKPTQHRKAIILQLKVKKKKKTKESACQCRGQGFDPWFRKTSHATGQLSPFAQLLSPHSRPCKLQLLKPTHPRARAPQQREPTTRKSPHTTTRE